MIGFHDIEVGRKYDRPTLAKMWGYESFHAISRGVITPKDQNVIVLFVTKDKQESQTQYQDHVAHDILFWEGETGHGSDERISHPRDEIHVFYRDRHHSDFTYKGRVILESFKRYSGRPSKFVFRFVDQPIEVPEIIAEIDHEYGLSQTEKDAIVKARIGQGRYRHNAITLWHTCSVTGFSKTDVLVASHIKPWKLSDNRERVNPYNSLLLVPTIDKLFDKGYIAFERNGSILLSDRIGEDDWSRVSISKDSRLRFIPDETTKYLDYHREYVFDLVAG